MSLKILNSQNFDQEVLSAKIPVLVDFYTEWCPPCKMLSPLLAELAQKYQGKIKIAKLNVEENQNLAIKYEVMSVPTLILFKESKEVKRLIGLQSQSELEKNLNLL